MILNCCFWDQSYSGFLYFWKRRSFLSFFRVRIQKLVNLYLFCQQLQSYYSVIAWDLISLNLNQINHYHHSILSFQVGPYFHCFQHLALHLYFSFLNIIAMHQFKIQLGCFQFLSSIYLRWRLHVTDFYSSF